MSRYVQFTEVNDWEGETWYFYLPLEGNAREIGRLAYLIRDSESYDIDFTQLTEEQVDTLVEFGGAGYLYYHNKVEGDLQDLPEELDPENDPFYKGGIEEFFK